MDTGSFESQVIQSIQASIDTKDRLLSDHELVVAVARVSTVLIESFRAGNKVLLFGNGGSAADAQHIAAEFVGRFAFNRPPLPAMALTVNTSVLTAIGNDYGFDQAFSRQVEAFARPGDVAIGISTSGGSPNVLDGLAAARRIGAHTVGLTGRNGDKMKQVSDYCICVPATETPRIQECHILVGHIISEIVEATLFQQQRGIAAR
jgi:D-sedoheptulose 7-phosphate isomerase